MVARVAELKSFEFCHAKNSMTKLYLRPDRWVIKLNLQSPGNSVGLGYVANNGPVPKCFPHRIGNSFLKMGTWPRSFKSFWQLLKIAIRVNKVKWLEEPKRRRTFMSEDPTRSSELHQNKKIPSFVSCLVLFSLV